MRKAIIYILLFVLLSCKKDPVEPAPVISSFTPAKGAYNITVAIRGQHFDSLITSTSVTFNGAAAQVVDISDTLITVIVPPNATTGRIAVTVEGRTGISSNDFMILSGKWILKRNPVATGFEMRHNAVSFVIGNKAYVGLGHNGGTSIKDLWEYDPATDSWTRKADCGIDFNGGMAMVINGKAYVGFGMSHNSPACCIYHKQIWEYDPVTNIWTRKADFPGVGRSGPFGIGLNGKGYMGFGTVNGGSNTNDWWEYDPSTDTWTQKMNPPAPSTTNALRYFMPGFSINNKIYVGTTAYQSGRDWYAYDPAINTWSRKTDYPGEVFFASGGFVLGNKGYVVGGGQECWEYDPSPDSWSQKAFFDHRIGGMAFSINNKGYYIGGSFKNDFWEFTQ